MTKTMVKFIITLFAVIGMVGLAGVLSGIGGVFLTMFIGGTLVSFILFLIYERDGGN